MDILNDQLRPYPPNPNNVDLSESELSENEEHVATLRKIKERRKRSRQICFDDWNMLYSDDLWYLWCLIVPFKENGVLDRMDYSSFCSMCYENSSKT
jgi:hypothetical protein